MEALCKEKGMKNQVSKWILRGFVPDKQTECPSKHESEDGDLMVCGGGCGSCRLRHLTRRADTRSFAIDLRKSNLPCIAMTEQ